jgi:arylsulfatase A-like enzyme
MGYLDNLVLADRALGLLRQSLEEAGLWDQSAILVSADHGWRTSFWRGTPQWTRAEEAASHSDTSRVPFLLKLPRQTSGVAYEKPLPTVVTRRLITAILSGRLTDPGTIPTAIARIEADKP